MERTSRVIRNESFHRFHHYFVRFPGFDFTKKKGVFCNFFLIRNLGFNQDIFQALTASHQFIYCQDRKLYSLG